MCVCVGVGCGVVYVSCVCVKSLVDEIKFVVCLMGGWVGEWGGWAHAHARPHPCLGVVRVRRVLGVMGAVTGTSQESIQPMEAQEEAEEEETVHSGCQRQRTAA
jgi:hypothetical protein